MIETLVLPDGTLLNVVAFVQGYNYKLQILDKGLYKLYNDKHEFIGRDGNSPGPYSWSKN
jgi:hypothetical protein